MTSATQIEKACVGVRYVIHLAALDAAKSGADPAQAMIVNTVGTVRLVEAAKRAGVERLIYLSTAHVYRAPLVGALSEETLPRPIHPYSISHRAAEDSVLAERVSGGLRGMVLRLSNALGAPAHPHMTQWRLVANDICRQAVTTGKIVLRSSGLQHRDFIALSDVGRAVRHLLTLPISQCDDGLFNLGRETSMRILDIAEMVAERCMAKLGFRPSIQRAEPAVGEQCAELHYSMAKLRATGFALRGSLVDEIDATLDLCRDAFGLRT
jgi:UDP-glucose 4-epimerase